MPRPFCVNRCFSSQSPHEYHIIDVIDKFAMDARCSLSELRKSKSGDFRGSPFAVRRLLECKMTLEVTYKVAAFLKDVVMRLNRRLLILERCLILESISSIVAAMEH